MTLIEDGAVTPPPTKTLRAVSPARAALLDKLLVVANENFMAAAFAVDRDRTILALAGADAMKHARVVSREAPDLKLLVEPTSHQTPATASDPWILPADDDGGMFDLNSVDDVLNQQKSAGALLAITPTGYVDAGDNAALRAVVAAANDLARDDVLVLLVLNPAWLVSGLKMLITQIKKIKHPVLIAFADPTRPLSSEKKLKAYRDLFDACANAIPWRTDLAGLDAYARGSDTFGIGMVPSLRRVNPPGRGGGAGDKSDQTPHILVAEELRIVKASSLKKRHVAHPAPLCSGDECHGRPLDRFNGSSADRLEGNVHTMRAFEGLHSRIALSANRRQEWSLMRADAEANALQLGQAIGAPVGVPDDVKAWQKFDRSET